METSDAVNPLSRKFCFTSYLSKSIKMQDALVISISGRNVQIWRYSRARSSHQRCSIRKAVLRNFAKIHRKHLPESFFNKVAGLRPQACNFIKKETLTQVFSCGFCEISKVVFFLRVYQIVILSYSFYIAVVILEIWFQSLLKDPNYFP